MSENRVTLLPLINTSPTEGLSRVPMIFSRVVFPEPDGPFKYDKAVFNDGQGNVLDGAYLVA